MATIKEIAALAGVSRGTVDRVLNDRGAVNPETAEKIRKIAKELDYKPNQPFFKCNHFGSINFHCAKPFCINLHILLHF